MKKLHVAGFTLFLALFCVGCGHSVVGVYEHKWQGYGGRENSMTFDFRSDGTCLYTPYLTSDGGHMSGGYDDGAPVISYDDRRVKDTWEQHGDEILVKIPNGNSIKFKFEGRDLISESDVRYVRIH